MIRDLYERDRAASMIGWVTMAMVIAPMLAPLIGGLLDTTFGWQAIFAFIGLFAAAVLVWATFELRETRKVATGEGFGHFLARERKPAPRPHIPRLRAGRRDQFGDVLHLHRRRAACRGHGHAPLARPNTASGSSILSLVYMMGNFAAGPLVGAIRRGRDDPRRRCRHGARCGGRHRVGADRAAAADRG